MAMTQAFSHWVSLGFNCEVAFQMRRVLGRDSSSFFSWNITPLAALSSLLDSRFAGILQPGNLSDHGDGVLVRDASHGYSFHSPFATPNPHDDPAFAGKLAEFRVKVGYLLDKFAAIAASGEPVAYFHRTEEPDARAIGEHLMELLGRYHGEVRNFVLVLIQPQDRQEPDWATPRLANRYLRRLAPFDDAPDGHVQSWDRIFAEFPHREPMRLAGF